MTDIPNLSRPHFYDGQALTAADLNAVQDYHRELLWLHQRTLHGSGIASGFAVSGAKGDKNVTIAPGYAIDTEGRSILLEAPVALDIPAVVSDGAGKAVTYYLTISYVPDDQLATAVRAGTCGSSGAVRRPDAPALAWRAPRDTGQDVVLCAITVLNCKLTGPVDVSPQRSALPERQPYVHAGQSTPADTVWELWPAGAAADGPVLGLRAAVNTSEAGFVNTPKYHVSVVGSREVRKDPKDEDFALLDGYAQVETPTATEFVVVVVLPSGDERVNPPWALDKVHLPSRIQGQWSVSWVGVED